MAHSPGNLSSTGSASSSFRSFWKKSSAETAESSPPQQQDGNDVTFVAQDPSPQGGHDGQSGPKSKEKNRISRLLKRTKNSFSSPTGSRDGDNDDGKPKSEAQKRREQVYQAQKRHRNRKAEYIKSLEAEVAKLQHLDSVVTIEKNALKQQNQQMRELLGANSMDFRLEAMSLAPPPTTNPAHSSSSLSFTADESASVSPMDFAFAGVNVHYDAEIGHERTFLEWMDMDIDWSATTTSTSAPASSTAGGRNSTDLSTTPSAPTIAKQPVQGDSWAALDFILALEHPCQGHIHHKGINPKGIVPVVDKESGCHGHALTATATVYESALPSVGQAGGRGGGGGGGGGENLLKVPGAVEKSETWALPHAEIDKLVQMAQQLPLDDMSITPAQAYSAIRGAVEADEQLRPCLSALKVPLSSLVSCTGFGAFMPTEGFTRELDRIIEQLSDGVQG